MNSLALSYAPLSTASIFSIPATLAASSATPLILLPATNPVTDPPSFWAAVTAPSEPWLSLPSFCSKTASEDSNRAKADRDATGVGVFLALNWVLACRRTEEPALEIILIVDSGKKT